MAPQNENVAPAISFRQLRLFEAIGNLQSVRRASEECSLSQPAVTQSLAKLEGEIGVVLVDRRASGSYLNDMGKLFHARVKRFLAQTEQAVVEAGAAPTATAARLIVNRLTRSQVRTIVAAIENGSFDRASEALGISAASLQRAARDLESNMRTSLFYRTAAGMLVSPLGTTFGRKMKLALQEIELGLEELTEAQGGTGRQIVIGAMPFGGSVMLASVLDDFLHLHPRADLLIVNEGASEMTRRLRSGEVELVLGLLPDTEVAEVVSEPLARTPYSVVVRRGHPLTAKGKISMDDLLGYDWVVGTEGSSRRACFDRLFDGRDLPQTPIATCALPVIRHLLTRSDRLTLMTSYELQHEDLRAIPFPIEPAPWIGLSMRADWLPTRLHTDLIGLVRAHAATPPVRELRRSA